MSLLQNHDLYPRLRCECCGYPTRSVAFGKSEDLSGADIQNGCILCDWDSAPVDDEGVPIADGPTAEERNGGYSLEVARANFLRHCWMYDPEVLEPWMSERPSVEELEMRRSLRAAYDELLLDYDNYVAWNRVLDIEAGLESIGRRRVDRAQGDDDAKDA